MYGSIRPLINKFFTYEIEPEITCIKFSNQHEDFE